MRPDEAGSDAVVARALRDGPFDAALRAAITARGWTFARLAQRLADRGVRVSATTLHYWSSGRSAPEKPESVAALSALEELLQIPDGSLTALRVGPRPRGRVRRGAALPVERLWDQPVALQRVVDELGCSYEGRRTISLHDRYRLDASGAEVSTRTTSVLEAADDEVDRFLAIYRDESGRGALPTVRVISGARTGRVRTDRPAGVIAAELLLNQLLRRGERTLVEYELCFPDGGGASPGCDRRFAAPIREFVLEVVFDPALLPTRCYAWRLPAGADRRERRELRIDSAYVARDVVLDAPAGAYGIEWEWPDDNS